MKRIATTFFFFILMLNSLSGQQSNWISTLFVEPTPSPYLSDWQNNPMLGRFTLTYNGLSPASFIFAVKITSPQYGELVAARSSQIDWPAGPYTQVYTPYDVLSWNDVKGLTFNNAMKERIVRSGRFPEGDFTLEILVKSMQGEVLNASSADFSIIYPEPPQLILPQNLEVVTIPQPFFQWSLVNAPITMPITYKIKIVERLNGQNINQALLANPVHHVDSVVGIGLYNYPMQGFPFVNGKEYIWQISTTDQEGNVVTSNNGKSEIWSFYFGTPPASQMPAPDTVKIVDGVAYLINMRNLNISPISIPGRDNGFTFNGSPTLVLNINGEEKSFNVTVNNLTVSIVQTGLVPFGPVNWKIEAGSISANMNPGIPIGDYLKATDLSYSIMDGLTIGGALSLPGITNLIPLSGRLTVNQFGLTGNLSVERPSNNPLMALGEGISKLLITKADIHFSEPEIKLGGILQLFGMNTDCNIQDLSVGVGGTINGNVTCNLNTAIPLVPNSDRLELKFNNITGSFSADLSTGSFSYNLQANAGLNLKTTAASNYGADLQISISNSQSSGGALNVLSFTPRGIANPPAIDLGWIQLAISNLSLAQLGFSNGNWDFSMGMDASIILPSFNNLALPFLQGATLGASGLTLPAMNLSSLNLPEFEIQGFKFEMLSARMASVTIPFFTGGIGATSGLNFSFDFKMRMPNFPAANIAAQIFNINNASFNNGLFSASIQSLTFNDPGIIIPISNDIKFFLKEFSGSLEANFSGAVPTLNPSIRIRGHLGLPAAGSIFGCPGGTGPLNLMTSSLNIDGNGKITGTIDNVNTTCSFELPPLSVSFSNVAINFNVSNNQQRINFEGEITARIANPAGGFIQGSGNINYELITNNIVSLNAEVIDPVSIKLPKNSSVFSFQIPKASITKDALLLDGRGYIALIGGTNIGVTFRNLNLRFQDFAIVSGDVIFDSPFAFKVTLDGGNPVYQTVPLNSSFSEQTGIMLNLPSTFSLGTNGFTATGSSSINLRFEGTSFDSLTANYSSNFAISLNPFKISAGQIEFFKQTKRIAYINPDGFFPDMSHFASQVLPEKIPLPTENIGYVVIKQGENFLVDYSNASNGVRIQTKPGQTVKLIMPILRFTRPTNPELEVSFDIVVNPQNYQLVSGSINAVVPSDQFEYWDLSAFGVPFSIANISFAQFSGGLGFQLSGKLKAFGSELGNPVNLNIFANGSLTGEIDFNLNKDIKIVGNSDKLNLNIKRITTSFDIPLSPLNLNFTLNLKGGIKLNLGAGRTYGANADFVVTRTGITVENFVIDNPIEMPKIDFSWFSLGLSNFSLPRLSYDPLNGWDFEIKLSALLNFPNIDFQLPKIDNLSIKKNGFSIPLVSIPEIQAAYKTVYGFAIKPVAFRMQAFTFDWFNMAAPSLDNCGFKFDFELSLSEMPASIPNPVRNIRLRVLDASFSKGKITGNIQAQNFSSPIQLPLGGTTNFLIKQIAGNLAPGTGNQDFNIFLGGDIQLPEFMRCGSNTGITPLTGTSLKINSKGKISGNITNFVPSCPINLGIGNLFITNSNLDFGFSGENQSLIISMSCNLKLPSTTSGDSINVSGSNIKFDLLTSKMIDGQITVSNPFKFEIPTVDPVLNITVNMAKLNKDGLMITGSGKLNLTGGTTANVNFSNFLFDYDELKVSSGAAYFSGQFALKFVVQSGDLKWSAIPSNAAMTEQTGVRLTMPSNVSLTANGMAASGETSVLVRVGGREYANVRAVFSTDFAISYSPFKVNNGDVKFYIGQTLAGVLNSNGFTPGDILGMIPLPEKIPLPDAAIAYLIVKQGENNLIETVPVQDGLRIATKPNQTVKLVIPGLQLGSSSPPTLNVSFAITVNPTTFKLVNGNINITAQSGQTLIPQNIIGLPIDITRIAYSLINGQPKLYVGGELKLPSVIGSAKVTFDSLIVSSTGITGTINVGKYNANYQPNGTYLTSVDLGTRVPNSNPASYNATFKIEGVSINLKNNQKSVKMSGDILSDIFRYESNERIPLHYTAEWASNKFEFKLNVLHLPQTTLSIGPASFKPQAIGGSPAMSLSITQNNFELILGGLLKVPSLSENFSIAFSGLKITKDGITIPTVSMPTSTQKFKLFGAEFALRDLSGTNRAISFAYTNRILYLTFNGDITFYGNKSQFKGLKIGTNGTFSLNEANLLTKPFSLAGGWVNISKLSIGTSGMRVDGFVKFPQPADTSYKKTFNFAVNSKGEISGGADIVLIDETAGLGGGDQTEWNFWVAKFDVTYASLKLNINDFNQSSFEVICAIYFMDKIDRYVRFGYKQGGNPLPGFKVKFNGNLSWGNIQISQNLSDIDLHALKMNITQASINTPGAGPLRVQLSGKLSIGLDGVSGSLNFNGLRVSAAGIMENLGSSITGGSFSLANVVTVNVNNISYIPGPASVWIKGGSTPTTGYGGKVDSQKVTVKDYYSFGANIDIAGVASGGVEEFLIYKTGNYTNLGIRNANLNVPNIIKFRADLVYIKQGTNYSLRIAGSGRIIDKYQVLVIGKVAQISGQTSFGLFVAASGLNITIPPAIILTGVGGGFFYNPDISDLLLVRDMCGLDANTKAQIVANPGKFAVLVYAQASFINNNFASGKILLTVTQNFFELRGELVLLNKANYFKGSAYLFVSFNTPAAIGEFQLSVNINPLVSGNAKLTLYFLRNEIWGVDGRMNIWLLNLIQYNSEFFVGSPGFYIAMGQHINIDIWILSVEAGFDVKIWWERNVSWGAYGAAYIRAKLMGITIAGCSFKAAIISGATTLIYGEAVWETWIYDFKFWGQIEDGRTNGGYGNNSTKYAQIKAAIDKASAMRNQKDEVIRQINLLK